MKKSLYKCLDNTMLSTAAGSKGYMQASLIRKVFNGGKNGAGISKSSRQKGLCRLFYTGLI